MSSKLSPCIGICKFRRSGPAGAHCIACSMTKPQKKAAKRLRKRDEAEGFLALVIAQQALMGRYVHWRDAFVARRRRKGRPVPDVVGSDGGGAAR